MKRVGFVLHAERREAVDLARTLAAMLSTEGVEVQAGGADAARIDSRDVTAAGSFPDGLDVVFVLGGDGTLLRAAQLVYDAGVPLLGVNLGRLGFLSELEPAEVEAGMRHILASGFLVEERMVLEGELFDGETATPLWALNDVIVAKESVGRAIKLQLEIAGEHLVAWAADGLIIATSTGATAYSFSAGGPVVSSALDCIVITPVAPHGLFDRSVIVPPTDEVVVRVLPDPDGVSLSADGRPPVKVGAEGVIRVRAGARRIKLAKVHPTPFWRLFRTKFGLPEAPRETSR